VGGGGSGGPDGFSFTDITAAALGVAYESDEIVVSGLGAPASLTVSGGEYAVNGGAYAATATSVSNGDVVKVRGTAAGAVSTAVDVALTIGGVSDTFRITTVANSEASDLLARFNADPGADRRGAVDALVGALKAASLWSQIDVLQMYAAHDSQAARLNWISPSFTAAPQNAPVFTADQGYTGDGSTAYVDSGFSETTAGRMFQAAAGIGTVAFGVSAVAPGTDVSTNYAVGLSSVGSLRVNPRNGSNAFFRMLCSSDLSIANPARAGRYLVTRDASPIVRLYKDGASLGAVTPGGIVTSANTIVALKGSGGNSDSRIQYLMIGGGSLWSATDAANFDAAIAAYLSAVGAT
jgi:hypothetical protein